MSDSKPANSGVSRARKLVSTALLLILLVVLAIEVRSAVGYAWSGSALSAQSKQGIIEKASLSEVKGMLKFWPNEELVKEESGTTEYRFSWYSLLAPLMSRDEPAYHVVMVRMGDAEGAVFDVETPNSGDVSRLKVSLSDGKFGLSSPPDESEAGSGGFESGDVQRDGPRRGGGPPTPPVDPLVSALDADDDGELSETELAEAVTALLKADKDGDGAISAEEARPVRPPGAGGGAGDRASRAQRQRPPLEDE